MKVKIRFHKHPCTNMTSCDTNLGGEICEDCDTCQCEATDYCCGQDHGSNFCPDCGSELDRPRCYSCDGGNCGCVRGSGELIEYGQDVFYSGTVEAEWVNGTLKYYRSNEGHPHLNGSHCLGSSAPLFDGVDTKEKAIEAIVTHISNVNFNDAVNAGPYTGIEV